MVFSLSFFVLTTIFVPMVKLSQFGTPYAGARLCPQPLFLVLPPAITNPFSTCQRLLAPTSALPISLLIGVATEPRRQQ